MSKKSSTLPLNLHEPKAGVPLYRWLYEELRSAILAGHLRPGLRLPATRELAAEYGLSRPTIVTAFEQLRSEGYVEGKIGSGTYVSKTLPEELLQAPLPKPSAKAQQSKISLSEYGRRLKPLPRTKSRPARAFRGGEPALDVFPTDLWAQVAARRLRRVSTSLLAGGEALGYRPLREAVAEYLNTSRGVKCSAEQVLIISGVQEALDRTAHLVLNPADPIWMEEPGYPGAAATFQAVGAKICPVPVDAEGLDLEHGRRTYPKPRLVYVTPAHQFPLGVTMSLRRRLSLLEWARRSRTLIFEDDYDSEYRYSGRPIPALQGLDRAGVVIFAGSFTNVLFPSLRLGYVVVPQNMVDVFAAAGSVSTHHPPLIDQAILGDFIREGHFARHVRRMRELYAERLSVLVEAARKRLGGVLKIADIEAGLRTVGWLQNGVSAEAAARAAAKRNVEVFPLSRYVYGRTRPNGLLLGFAAVDAKELRRGVEDLARALEGCK
ncbi:MAG: PLP-dependent aminotransferase family protein [Acidobacteriaceae bacterium]|nr:PLP-dependent aminotransferase family protein [Acidobacteriaceae bacterium]